MDLGVEMFLENKNTIKLSNLWNQNYKNLNGTDFNFSYLNPDIIGNKGGNSFVFRIFDAQNEGIDFVIKISSTHEQKRSVSSRVKKDRFKREIDALKLTKQHNFENIINFIDDGIIKIPNEGKTHNYEFRYYIMEHADCDLKEYILSENVLDVQEKVQICSDICRSIYQLNEIGVYHRDIKPDNIFKVQGIWKLGDLGLVDYRDEDKNIDRVNDRIGPFGWHSPETMNKWLTAEKKAEFEFDCNLDHQSDIYQLGMVFWFIFQGNAPIGQIKTEDFLCDFNTKHKMYSIIYKSLNHLKENRHQHIDSLITSLSEIEEEIGL